MQPLPVLPTIWVPGECLRGCAFPPFQGKVQSFPRSSTGGGGNGTTVGRASGKYLSISVFTQTSVPSKLTPAAHTFYIFITSCKASLSSGQLAFTSLCGGSSTRWLWNDWGPFYGCRHSVEMY